MRIIILFLCGLVFVGCSHNLSSTVDNSVNSATGQIGCANFSSNVWDVVTTSLIDDQALPEASAVRSSLAKKISNKFRSLEATKADQVSSAVGEFVSYLQNEFSKTKDANQLLATVVALEVGDHSDDIAIARQNRLDVLVKNINEASVKTQQNCEVSDSPSASIPAGQVPIIYGARKAMATAYQSCHSLEVPALNEHSAKLQGIIYNGMHSDGIGRKRFIGNLGLLQATDPYIETSYGANCIRVRDNPLIYDYGGKPYTTSSDSSLLDFFKNAGSGTSVLGIDCSGFVFSAIATSGLRIAPNTAMKARYVMGIQARMFMNPEQNGLSCFERLKVGTSGDIKAGDVIAGTGHINIVDSAGADPLGISKAKTSAECDLITSDDFDFILIQSSSNLDIGVNRFEGRSDPAKHLFQRIGLCRLDERNLRALL